MALTANDYAQQMIAQARVLDPSFSGEIGTPERKIIDTVAQALAETQIDLTGLAGALDIDSKFGANLDRFTALFGFQRQQAQAATGFVVFSRNTPAPAQITVPVGTVLQSKPVSTESLNTVMQYVTTATGSININQTDSSAVPIRAVVTGSVGNGPAHSITQIVGGAGGSATTLPGVTSVTNPNPLTNGLDVEDDNSFKVRFKNTWARNLAGTADQYLALAIAGPYTTKANVIGVQSRYREYVQVPEFDDAGYRNGAYYLEEDTVGNQNEWTTALSDIPFAKYIYTTIGTFVSNDASGLAQYFYRPHIDYDFNFLPVVRGDAVRSLETRTTGGQVLTGVQVNITSPGDQTNVLADVVSLQIVAVDSDASTPTLTATALPDGLSMTTSGLITGIPTHANIYNVTITGRAPTSETGSITFQWTINSSGPPPPPPPPGAGVFGGPGTFAGTGNGPGKFGQ